MRGDASLVQRVRECCFGTDVQLLVRYGLLAASGAAGVPSADEIHTRVTNTCLKAYARRGLKKTQTKALHDIEDYYLVAQAKNLKPDELKDVPDGRLVHVMPNCIGSGRVRIDDATATECQWYRRNRMTGPAVPELEAAVAAGDDFTVDFVRVYDVDFPSQAAG